MDQNTTILFNAAFRSFFEGKTSHEGKHGLPLWQTTCAVLNSHSHTAKIEPLSRWNAMLIEAAFVQSISWYPYDFFRSWNKYCLTHLNEMGQTTMDLTKCPPWPGSKNKARGQVSPKRLRCFKLKLSQPWKPIIIFSFIQTIVCSVGL